MTPPFPTDTGRDARSEEASRAVSRPALLPARAVQQRLMPGAPGPALAARVRVPRPGPVVADRRQLKLPW